jgi:NTE family protein
MSDRIKRNTKSKLASTSSLESVLILQGGGSLGAFGCGVFKSLANNGIKLDIIAGTSIGGVNAAIIAGSKDEKYPEKILEQFWLELAESSRALDSFPSSLHSVPFLSFIHWLDKIERSHFSAIQNGLLSLQSPENNRDDENLRIKSILSSYGSAVYGNDKFFKPRWRQEYAFSDPDYPMPAKWTYLYDHSPLVKTLEKYIDYDKLQPNGQPNTRLIMTAVNVLTAQPLTFDSYKQQITPKHILATCGYPVYAFPWVEVENGVYAWDGGLLSNTPLAEVIDASPVKDKQVFLVENYPKKIDKLPENLPEVYHRARDIMFSDKTELNISLSKVISMYLRYIDEMYKFIEDSIDKDKVDKRQLEKIRLKYKKYKKERGAEIKKIWYITRDEAFPFIYENADFSVETIKSSIKDGELKTNQILEAQSA